MLLMHEKANLTELKRFSQGIEFILKNAESTEVLDLVKGYVQDGTNVIDAALVEEELSPGFEEVVSFFRLMKHSHFVPAQRYAQAALAVLVGEVPA